MVFLILSIQVHENIPFGLQFHTDRPGMLISKKLSLAPRED